MTGTGLKTLATEIEIVTGTPPYEAVTFMYPTVVGCGRKFPVKEQVQVVSRQSVYDPVETDQCDRYVSPVNVGTLSVPSYMFTTICFENAFPVGETDVALSAD